MIHMTPHEAALKRLNLKVGDKVRIISKAESYKRGWDDSWTSYMDPSIGKKAVVISVSQYGVRFRDDHFEITWRSYIYPAFCLEKIK